jgi:hypothetical protein
MTLLEGMIGIIAIALLIAVIVLTRLARRIGAAADDVGLAARRVAELAPAARGLIESGQAELTALRSISGTAEDVVDDVRAVTSQASYLTSRVLRGFESELIDRYRAIFAGARAGFDVLRQLRGGNGSVEVEDFDHMEK